MGRAWWVGETGRFLTATGGIAGTRSSPGARGAGTRLEFLMLRLV